MKTKGKKIDDQNLEKASGGFVAYEASLWKGDRILLETPAGIYLDIEEADKLNERLGKKVFSPGPYTVEQFSDRGIKSSDVENLTNILQNEYGLKCTGSNFEINSH